MFKVILLTFCFFVVSCKSSDPAGSNKDSVLESTFAQSPLSDGCYVLNPLTVYGYVCVRGLAEEGIGGSDVKVASIRDDGRVHKCLVSTEVHVTPNVTTIIFPDSKAIFTGNSSSGKVEMFGANPQYSRATSFKPNWIDSPECKRAIGVPATESSACKTYIGKCDNGKAPVDCQNSYFCIDEQGGNYPNCVSKDKLYDQANDVRCGTPAKCKQCPK